MPMADGQAILRGCVHLFSHVLLTLLAGVIALK